MFGIILTGVLYGLKYIKQPIKKYLIYPDHAAAGQEEAAEGGGVPGAGQGTQDVLLHRVQGGPQDSVQALRQVGIIVEESD